jgi:hypothetical protein
MMAKQSSNNDQFHGPVIYLLKKMQCVLEPADTECSEKQNDPQILDVKMMRCQILNPLIQDLSNIISVQISLYRNVLKNVRACMSL